MSLSNSSKTYAYQKTYLDDLQNTGLPSEKDMVNYCLDKAALHFVRSTVTKSDLLMKTDLLELLARYMADAKATQKEAEAKLIEIYTMAVNVTGEVFAKAFSKTALRKESAKAEVEQGATDPLDRFFYEFERGLDKSHEG